MMQSRGSFAWDWITKGSCVTGRPPGAPALDSTCQFLPRISPSLSLSLRDASRARAQVGVDVNAAAATPWRAPPLAFVAGLGPRKAQALLRAAVREKGVQARADLWRQPNNPDQPPLAVFGRCVFRCAGRPPRANHPASWPRPAALSPPSLMSFVTENELGRGSAPGCAPARLRSLLCCTTRQTRRAAFR